MKVLQILPQMADGGAERFVLDLSNELSKRHHVVLCLFFDPRPEFLHLVKEIDSSIKVVSCGKKLGFDFRVILKLFRVLVNESPDVVHTHLSALQYVSFWAIGFRKIRFFHTLHNDAIKEARTGTGLLLRRFLFGAKHVEPITISPGSLDSFRSVYGYDVAMINNGRRFPARTDCYDDVLREVGGYRVTPRTKVYIHVGRVEPQKNQLMLVDAFKQFVSDVDAVLLLIGGNRNEDLWEQLHKAVDHEPRVFILGPKDNATDYLHAAEFFCLSSVHEGLPISLLEAMACKALPVCTPVGGIPSVIQNGKNGMLSSSVDQDSYVAALGLSSQSAAYDGLVAAASESYLSNYTMEVCGEQYNNLFGTRKLTQL